MKIEITSEEKIVILLALRERIKNWKPTFESNYSSESMKKYAIKTINEAQDLIEKIEKMV